MQRHLASKKKETETFVTELFLKPRMQDSIYLKEIIISHSTALNTSVDTCIKFQPNMASADC